ncbi:MAG: hypothetical protein J0M16_11120 [Gammaproteobacteria bacterium]|jgi:hypothetical protein|nr:hypothetical protein [Gammaproteobacteria bacterium]
MRKGLQWAAWLACWPLAALAVRPDDFTCQPGDDTGCWQRALVAAQPEATKPAFFGVEARPRIYRLTDTLVIHGALGGVIDGKGAILEWWGPADRPAFLVTNSQQLRFRDLRIRARKPLQAGFEFAKRRYTEANRNLWVAPSQNYLDHIRIDAVGLNDLRYGIRFSKRYGIDEDNDQATFDAVTIANVTVAAISIEHSQSQAHNIREVRASGAPGNTNAAFIRATGGSFDVWGGTRTGFRGAVYDLTGVNGADTIIGENAEACARLVRTPRGAAGFPFPVTFYGGRFAVDEIAPDGRWVDFHRFGPLALVGMSIDGTPKVQPRVRFWPWPPGGGYSRGQLTLQGVAFSYAGSALADPVEASPYAAVNSTSHLCQDGTGTLQDCYPSR